MKAKTRLNKGQIKGLIKARLRLTRGSIKAKSRLHNGLLKVTSRLKPARRNEP